MAHELAGDWGARGLHTMMDWCYLAALAGTYWNRREAVWCTAQHRWGALCCTAHARKCDSMSKQEEIYKEMSCLKYAGQRLWVPESCHGFYDLNDIRIWCSGCACFVINVRQEVSYRAFKTSFPVNSRTYQRGRTRRTGSFAARPDPGD